MDLYLMEEMLDEIEEEMLMNVCSGITIGT